MLPRITLALSFTFALIPANAADDAKAVAKIREVIGHQGSCADRPGNTLIGLRRAIEAGAGVSEVDVRTTKDGVLVCFHDEEVDKLTDGKGKIADLTLAELKMLDVGSKFDAKYKGERIPTLREVLEVAKGKIGVMVDLKENGEDYVRKIVGEARQFGNPTRLVVGIRSVEQSLLFHQFLPVARRIGLVPTQDDIEPFVKAGVKTIRIWPKWLSDESLVPRVRKLGAELLLDTGKGTKEEVLAMLRYEPEWLASDDPTQLVKTLKELRGK